MPDKLDIDVLRITQPTVYAVVKSLYAKCAELERRVAELETDQHIIYTTILKGRSSGEYSSAR